MKNPPMWRVGEATKAEKTTSAVVAVAVADASDLHHLASAVVAVAPLYKPSVN